MKKILLILTLMIGLFSSCTNCGGNKVEKRTESDSVVVQPVYLDFARVLAVNHQDMYNNYSEEYGWYKSNILLNNYIDSTDCNIIGISNLFKDSINNILFVNCSDSISVVESENKLDDLNVIEDINIDFVRALDTLSKTNCPKPHTNVVSLIYLSNWDSPKYVFADDSIQVYVNARTGEVTTEPKGFTMPLGEWP